MKFSREIVKTLSQSMKVVFEVLRFYFVPAIFVPVKKNTNKPRSRKDASPENEMSFWEHLEELRMTLLACLIAFVLAASASLFFYKEIFRFLRLPLEYALREIGESDIAMISASSIRAGLEYTVDLSIPSSVKTASQNNFIAAEGPYRVQDFMVSGEPWMSERNIRSR